jgi:hypothetical protein
MNSDAPMHVASSHPRPLADATSVSVQIHILGTFDPVLVTQRLGVSPTEVGRKGLPGATRRVPEPDDRWTIATAFTRTEISTDEHFSALLGRLGDPSRVRKQLSDVSVRLCASVIAYIHSGVAPHICISGRTIKVLSMLDVEGIDIDTFVI